MTNPESIEKQRHYVADKGPSSQKYGFPIVMYGCENWTVKKSEHWIIDAFELWCLRRLLRVPWTARDKPVHPKGNQSLIFIGRTDAEAETSILWPPYAKNWLIGKDPDAEQDWRQEKGTAEDDIVGWHHQLCGHEFEQAPGVGEGQGSLVSCSPWGRKSRTGLSDWTELDSDSGLVPTSCGPQFWFALRQILTRIFNDELAFMCHLSLQRELH